MTVQDEVVLDAGRALDELLARRTPVCVARLIVEKIRLAETSFCLGADRYDPSLFAGQNLDAGEVTTIGQDCRSLSTRRIFDLPAHVGELRAVMAYVGDVVRHDDVADRRGAMPIAHAIGKLLDASGGHRGSTHGAAGVPASPQIGSAHLG